MFNNKLIILFFVFFTNFRLGYASTLVDENNGLILDTSTGIQWMKNADLGATNSFGISYSRSGFDHQDALNWISALNQNNYLGHNDWVLPSITDLLHLFDYSLGNYGNPNAGPYGDGWNFNLSPFVNFRAVTGPGYWSNTIYITPYQTNEPIYWYLWPTSSTDIDLAYGPHAYFNGINVPYLVLPEISPSTTPIPAAFWLVGSPLAGLIFFRKRHGRPGKVKIGASSIALDTDRPSAKSESPYVTGIIS